MSTPREWRNIRKGHKLLRLEGGEAFLVGFTRSTATVQFPNRKKHTVCYDTLYRHYKPA